MIEGSAMAEVLPSERTPSWLPTIGKRKAVHISSEREMDANEVARFFNTSGCLNLTRPTNDTSAGTTVYPRQDRRRPASSSVPRRSQLKIDLYNFDHIDFADSKYVLTSPRSLEACARLNIKPIILLPKRLADIQDDIGSERVRLATLADVRDQMEIDRLANLQRCREEREKIIREESQAYASSSGVVEPRPFSAHNGSIPPRTYVETRFRPSSSLIHGLQEPTTVNSIPTGPSSSTAMHFSAYDASAQLPPRPTYSSGPTISSSILKSSNSRRTPPPTATHASFYEHEDDGHDGPYGIRPSSSVSFVDDVQRMNRSLQRMSTSGSATRQHHDDRYINGLENVKEMLERRAAHSRVRGDPTVAGFERRQYDILLNHYDHELKIQRAREKARRTKAEKTVERYSTLLHELSDHQAAEERRQNELRRKISKLHSSRELHSALQAKNFEEQEAEREKRRYELLSNVVDKERRSRHYIKEKQAANDLSRTLAHSSHDLRAHMRESKENFNDRARNAELKSGVLSKRSTTPGNRRHLQSSIRT